MSSNSQLALLARMLLDQETWLRRRTLTIELVDLEWARRTVVVESELDRELIRHAKRMSQDVYYLPIALMEKRPGRSMEYQLKDESGDVLQVPRLSETTNIGGKLLPHLLKRCAIDPASPESQVEVPELTSAVGAPANSPLERLNATEALDRLIANSGLWIDVARKEKFEWVCLQLIDRGLVACTLPVERPERIIRFSCMTELLSPRAKPIALTTRAGFKASLVPMELAGWCGGSAHVQLSAPEGLELVHADLKGVPLPSLMTTSTKRDFEIPEPASASKQGDPESKPSPPSRFRHLYKSDVSNSYTWELDVFLRAERSGFVSAAWWVAVVTALELWLLVAFKSQIADDHDPVISLLLAFPLLGAAAVAQFAGHPIARYLLELTRRAVFGIVLLVLAACIFVITDEAGDSHEHGRGLHYLVDWAGDNTLWFCAVGLTWIAILAALVRRLPRPVADQENANLMVKAVEKFGRGLVLPLVWGLAGFKRSWPLR